MKKKKSTDPTDTQLDGLNAAVPKLKMVRGKVVTIQKARKERNLWKSRTKKAGSYQRPLAAALKKSSEALVAAVEVQNIVESMNDKGRRLFAALTMGMNELEAVYEADLQDFYIWPHSRIAIRHDGEKVPIQNITKYNLSSLHPESYRKIREICTHAMDVAARTHDYSIYIRDINDAFKIVAPEAFKVMNQVMMNPLEKGQTRLNAAKEVLDRAGYGVKEESAAKEMPAQVNILITDNPAGTVEVFGGMDNDGYQK